MKRCGIFGVLAVAAMVAGPAFASTAVEYGVTTEDVAPRPSRQERRRRSSSFVNADRRYRNRWKAQRPKRRSNRLHISRRTRRRHRGGG